MKKLFCVFSWFSGVFGVVLMIIGGILFLVGHPILGIKNWENVFYPAYNFLILAILFLLASRGDCKK